MKKYGLTFDERGVPLEDAPSPLDDSNVSDQLRYVSVGPVKPSYVKQASSIDEDVVGTFIKGFSMEIQRLEKKEKEGILVMDLIGIDAPVANALRRILISEIPTMTIEKVFISNNTSVIQDEVLAHRLGLIPILVDPREFERKMEGADPDEGDTLVFNLKVRCTKKTDLPSSSQELTPELMYNHSSVYSSDLIWEPVGEQAEIFSAQPVRPVHDDILIAKLRPGQVIDLVAHCHLGIGEEHAKWSPVSTASYRLHPRVSLVEPVVGKDAAELVAKCPMNVFDIEDSAAVVARERNCSMCRECIRGDGWENRVKLQRERNRFIFSIESTGVLPPDVLFKEAVKILGQKCDAISSEIDLIQEGEM